MTKSEAKGIADKIFYIHNVNAGNKLNPTGDNFPYKVMYRHSLGINDGHHRILNHCSTREQAEEKLSYFKKGFLRTINEFVEV